MISSEEKLTYIKISKTILLSVWIILSVLCFPKINSGFFNNLDFFASVIWVVLIALMIVVSIFNIFFGRKILPKLYTVGSLIFSIILFGFSWIESIHISYDSTSSMRFLFIAVACVFFIISVLLYVLSKKHNGKTKKQ